MQSAFMQSLAVSHKKLYPVTFAIPNGGHRSVTEGARFRREGVKAGVPDIFIAYPTKEYSGLFIEFKVHPNKPSLCQKAMMENLIRCGYKCVVCYSREQAETDVRNYLNGPEY